MNNRSGQALLTGTHGFFLERGECAVLLVHAIGGAPAQVRYVGHQLAHQGLTVLCPQLPGHGESINVLAKSQPAAWLLALGEALDYLASRYTHVVVAGLSDGALLATLLAHQHPAKVRGLVLMSPLFTRDGVSAGSPATRWWQAMLRRSPVGRWFSWRIHHPFGIKDSHLRLQLLQAYRQARPKMASKLGHAQLPTRAVLQSQALAHEALAVLRHVQCPVLLAHAEQDDQASAHNAQVVQAAVPPQCLDVLTLTNSHHLLTLDGERDLLVDLLVRFVQQVRKGACLPQAAPFIGL